MPGLVSGEQLRRLLRTNLVKDLGPPDLRLENPHEDVPYLVDHQAVPRLPGLWGYSRYLILHRQDRRRLDESVDTASVRIHHLPGPLADGLVVGPGAGLQPESPHHLVLVHRRRPHHLRPASRSPQAVVFHVPELVLGSNEALGEKRVALAGGPDVRNAVAVPVHVHGGFQSRKGDLSAQGRDRCFQLIKTYHAALR